MTHAATLFRGLLVAWLVVGAASLAAATAPATATNPAVAGPSGDGSAAAQTAQSNGTMTFRTVDAEPGETVTVQLRTNAGGVAGYQANISFDPSVVQVVSVSGADWDAPVYNADNEAGWVFLTQSRAREADAPGLATITFEIVGEVDGSIDLSFVEDDTLVNDAESQTIPVSLDRQPVSTEPTALGSQDASADGSQDGSDAGTDQSNPGGDENGGSGLPDSLLVLAGIGVGGALVVGVLAGKRFG